MATKNSNTKNTKTTTKTTVKVNEEIKEPIVVEEKETITTKAVEEVVKESVAEAVKEAMKEVVKEAAEEVEPVIKNEKKVFSDSDYILCRSVWSGGLNITSQSGNLYRFNGYGAECEINYRDLVTLIRKGSEHVFLPRFVILDADFLEDFPTIQKVYGEMYTMKDLVDILELPVPQMTSEIANLPDTTKNSMRNLVATQIANGQLDSVKKIRALSEIFNSDFNLLNDLFR